MKKKVAVSLVTAVVVFIILFLTYFAIQYVGSKLSEGSIAEESNNALIAAQNIANDVEVDVANTYDKLILLSQSSQIRSGNGAECQKKLEEVISTFGDKPEQIGRTDKNGIFICSIIKTIIGTDARLIHPSIQKFYDDPEHKPIMTEIIQSPGTDRYSVVIIVPVFDELQNFVGGLGIPIYLDTFNERYFSTGVLLGNGRYFAVWDEKGDVIYHPDSSLIGKNVLGTDIQQDIVQRDAFKKMIDESALGKAGTTRYIFRGDERIASYSPANIFTGKHWTIIAVAPLSGILLTENEQQTQKNLFGLFMVNIFLAIIGSTFVILYAIRTFFNPIEELTEQIQQLSEGRFDIQIDQNVKKKNDEIGNLARAFDRILLSLKLAVKKVGLTKEELNLGTLIEEKKKVERELKKSESFVQDIVEHAGIPIIAYSKEGHLMIANKELLSATKYPKEELISRDKTIDLFFPAEEPKTKFKSAIQAFYRGEQVSDFVIPIYCKNKSTIVAVANITGIRNEQGGLIGEVIFLRDLSKIFELEAQIRHWAANGFVQTNEKGKSRLSLGNIEISGSKRNKSIIEDKNSKNTDAAKSKR